MSYQVFDNVKDYAEYIKKQDWGSYGGYDKPINEHIYEPNYIGDCTTCLVRFEAPIGIFSRDNWQELLERYIPESASSESAVPVGVKIWMGPITSSSRRYYLMEYSVHGSIVLAPIISKIVAALFSGGALAIIAWIAVTLIAVLIFILLSKFADGIKDITGSLAEVLLSTSRYLLPLALMICGTIVLVSYYNKNKVVVRK